MDFDEEPAPMLSEVPRAPEFFSADGMANHRFNFGKVRDDNGPRVF